MRTLILPRNILESLPSQRSPVSELIGVPLNVAGVNCDQCLAEYAHYANRLAALLMIDPVSGFDPNGLQALVGPVVVWRPGGEDFSTDDACLVLGFVENLLAGYRGVRVHRDVTPVQFQEYKLLATGSAELDSRCDPYEDVNI